MKSIVKLIFCATALAACQVGGAETTGEKTPKQLSLMTYNIKNGAGMDNKTDYERTAGVIVAAGADIVGLQEVDEKTSRSRKTDVLKELATHAKMEGTYAKAIDYQGGAYGIGLLSREKPQKVERIPLPGREEKRVLLEAEFPDYVIFVTHLSLTTEDRLSSLDIIAKEASKYKKPVYLMGDLNFTPKAEEMKRLEKDFIVLNNKNEATFPAPAPRECIDYIALYKGKGQSSKPVKPVSAKVVNEPVASDHRPVQVILPMK